MNPTAHDWFAGLLSTGQWLTIFIVAGIAFAVGLSIWAAKDGEQASGVRGAFFAGLLGPILLWGFIMGILHFVSFLVGLWNWDFVPMVRS